MIVLLVIPLVSAFMNPEDDSTMGELAQVNYYNNGIVALVLVVALTLIAIVYYFLTRKNFEKVKKKRGKKKNGKKRNHRV